VYPSHNYKFAPILQFIKKIVQSNRFGQIINGHFRVIRSGHAVGIPEWNPHWRRYPEISGGGILRDHGPHSIYIACDMCGKTPTAVSCITGNLKADQYVDTEDTALLTIYFNDIKFLIDISWASSFRNSYYAISGSEENIIVENDELIHTGKDGKLIRQFMYSEFNDPSHKAWFRDMFSDFIDTVTTPTKQLPLLREAFITSLVIEQAYSSAKLGGKLIELPKMPEVFIIYKIYFKISPTQLLRKWTAA
jgi:predicted dehydrogenase